MCVPVHVCVSLVDLHPDPLERKTGLGHSYHMCLCEGCITVLYHRVCLCSSVWPAIESQNH